MSFVTWAALAVGLLLVVPVVAHMLRRRPPEELGFAPTALVPERTAVAQRRPAIEDRALLVIRALAVVALAVLGATPLVRCQRLSLARKAGGSVALAVVLDDSLSMQVRLADSEQTRFERARRAARELVAGLRPGDAVALVLAGAPARVALGTGSSFAAVAEALEAVQVSDRGTDLRTAVQVGGELLAGLAQTDKRVVVLSDLAERGAGGQPLQAPGQAALWVPLPQLAAAAEDCAVVAADQHGGRVNVRVACSPGGAVAAASSAAAELGRRRAARRVEIRAGDKLLVSSRLWLTGDQGTSSLALPEQHDGALQLWAVLSGSDAIGADDAAPVMSLGTALRVGVVADAATSQVATGGPPPVEQALAALPLGVQAQPLSAVPDRAADLQAFRLLVIDDVPGLTPATRAALGEWLTAGGVALLTLGPRAAAAPLGSSFAPVLTGAVRWRTQAPAGIDLQRDDFFGEAADGMDALAAKGRAEIELGRAGEVRTLARWNDGAPLLIERRVGRGLAYCLTLPLSTELSDLALRPGFLELLMRLLDAARSHGGSARIAAGEAWPLTGYDQVKAFRVGRDDRRTPVALGSGGKEGQRRLVPARIGLYEIELDGRLARRVAAPDEDEIDLRPLPVNEQAASSALGGVSADLDASSYAAIALLLIMLIELVLRAITARSSAAPAVRVAAAAPPAAAGDG